MRASNDAVESGEISKIAFITAFIVLTLRLHRYENFNKALLMQGRKVFILIDSIKKYLVANLILNFNSDDVFGLGILLVISLQGIK